MIQVGVLREHKTEPIEAVQEYKKMILPIEGKTDLNNPKITEQSE